MMSLKVECFQHDSLEPIPIELWSNLESSSWEGESWLFW